MTNANQKSPRDWRYRVATTVVKEARWPDGRIIPAGTPASVSTFIKQGDKVIRVGDPSAPALYLSHANRCYEQAIAIHPFDANWPLPPETDPSHVVYDYLESMMAAIVFSYSAIEAMANEQIPDKFIYEEKNEPGVLIARDRAWIERRLSLDRKLIEVLPKVKGKVSPKGLNIWGGYVQLGRLRDRLVHLKSSDRAYSKHGNLYPMSIWTKLLEPKQPHYPRAAKQIIEHFLEISETHWLMYCPF